MIKQFIAQNNSRGGVLRKYTFRLLNALTKTIYIWDSTTVAGSPTYILESGRIMNITINGGMTIEFPSQTSSYTCKIRPGQGNLLWSQYIPAQGERRAIIDEPLFVDLEAGSNAGSDGRIYV